MAETVDPKDPNATNRFGWDLTAICLQADATLTNATVIEVDAADAAVAGSTVTISGLAFTSDGIVTALIGGGTVGTSIYLRCRYTLSNGETDDRTIKVRIAHQ